MNAAVCVGLFFLVMGAGLFWREFNRSGHPEEILIMLIAEAGIMILGIVFVVHFYGMPPPH